MARIFARTGFNSRGLALPALRISKPNRASVRSMLFQPRRQPDQSREDDKTGNDNGNSSKVGRKVLRNPDLCRTYESPEQYEDYRKRDQRYP